MKVWGCTIRFGHVCDRLPRSGFKPLLHPPHRLALLNDPTNGIGKSSGNAFFCIALFRRQMVLYLAQGAAAKMLVWQEKDYRPEFSGADRTL